MAESQCKASKWLMHIKWLHIRNLAEENWRKYQLTKLAKSPLLFLICVEALTVANSNTSLSNRKNWTMSVPIAILLLLESAKTWGKILHWVYWKRKRACVAINHAAFLMIFLNFERSYYHYSSRKLESSTSCTFVNCGKLLKPILPRSLGNWWCSRWGNAHRMVKTNRMTALRHDNGQSAAKLQSGEGSETIIEWAQA